ncbi:carboxypeptidase regulatory-like domain-containing protein [Planctomycetota bacterium]
MNSDNNYAVVAVMVLVVLAVIGTAAYFTYNIEEPIVDMDQVPTVPATAAEEAAEDTSAGGAQPSHTEPKIPVVSEPDDSGGKAEIPPVLIEGKYTYIIKGKAIDANTQQPIAGVELDIESFRRKSKNGGQYFDGTKSSDYHPNSFFTTNSEGEYKIVLSGREEVFNRCYISHKCNEYLKDTVRIVLDNPGAENKWLSETEYTFELIRGVLAAGTVYTPEGAPLKDAEVTPYQVSDRQRYNSLDSTKTDEKGNFQVSVPEGNYRFMAEHADYAAGSSDTVEVSSEGIDGVRINLIYGGTLRGTVTDENGTPLAADINFHRELKLSSQRETFFLQRSSRVSKTIAEDGSYEIKNIVPGNYQFTVNIEGYVGYSEKLVFEGVRERIVNPVLTKGSEVKILVLNEEGKPVEGARVSIGGASPETWQTSSAHKNTDNEGRVTLGGLQNGPHSMDVNADGYMNLDKHIFTVPVRDEIIITLKLSPFIFVQARDKESGKFLEKYTIHLKQGRGGMFFEEKTTAVTSSEPYKVTISGDFTSVTVTADGYAESDACPLSKSVYNRSNPIIFGMASGGGIKGKILKTDGSPLEGAMVSIVTAKQAKNPAMFMGMLWSGSKDEKNMTDKDGCFELRDLKPGNDMTLIVFHEQFNSLRKDGITITRNEIYDVGVLSLLPGARIEGEVLDMEGNPIEGADIQVINMKLGDAKDATTDKDGRFVIETITPGSITIMFFGGGKSQMRSITVKAGETKHVKIGGSGEGGSIKIDYRLNDGPGPGVTIIRMSGNATTFVTLEGKDGHFESGNLEEGSYVIFPSLTGDDLPAGEYPVYIQKGLTTFKEIHLQTGSLRLNVKNEFGEVVPDVKVMINAHAMPFFKNLVYTVGSFDPDFGKQDQDGNIVFGNMVSGHYEIALYATNYQTLSIPDIEVKVASEAYREVRLKKIISPGSVKVNLLTQDGGAAQGMLVMLLCDDRGFPIYRMSDMESIFMGGGGEYKISTVPAGSYTLRMVSMAAGPGATAVVNVGPGQDVVKDVILAEPGTMIVDVVDGEGVPQSNVPVTIIDAYNNDLSFQLFFMGMEMLGNFTDENGMIKRAYLETGCYTIKAQGQGRSAKAEKVYINSDQETRVTLILK